MFLSKGSPIGRRAALRYCLPCRRISQLAGSTPLSDSRITMLRPGYGGFDTPRTSANNKAPIRARPRTYGTDSCSRSNRIATSNLSPTSTCSSPHDTRCSRCWKMASEILQLPQTIMLRYGLNLWYCSRCTRTMSRKPQ